MGSVCAPAGPAVGTAPRIDREGAQHKELLKVSSDAEDAL